VKTFSQESAIRQSYTEALEKALGRVVADARKNVEQQAAESRAVIAELKMQIVVLQSELRQMIADKLATIKDGEKGERGEKGETGQQGPQGEKGQDGAQGQAGLQGARGSDGSDGSPGAQGERGERGTDGAAGERGERGPSGEPGQRGDRGAEGKQGRLPVIKEWTDKVHYDGSVVTYRGATYQACGDTAKEPGIGDDWICLAARGIDGRTFKVRGTYSPDKLYSHLDIVACNSGSFAALKDGAGVCPGPDWQLIAGPGKRGDKGLPGDKGSTGPKGADGQTIIGWKKKQYVIIPILTDGSEGPPLSIKDILQRHSEEVD